MHLDSDDARDLGLEEATPAEDQREKASQSLQEGLPVSCSNQRQADEAIDQSDRRLETAYQKSASIARL